MKNRKKQFLKLGIILLAIAVTGTVAGIIQYKKANQFDLTVAEHVISKEEYLNCMKAVEYDTKIQIQQEYALYMKMTSGKNSMMENTGMKFWRIIQ